MALFAPILPAGLAALQIEALLDRRLHVIVAFAFVLHQHAGGIELPRRHDMIAAPAIVVGIFDADRAAGVLLHRLRSGRITLDKNLIGSLRGQRLSDSGER